MGKWEVLLEFSTIPSFFEFLQATSETNETLISFPLSRQCFGIPYSCFVTRGKTNVFSREVSAEELLLCDPKQLLNTWKSEFLSQEGGKENVEEGYSASSMCL